MQCVIVVFPDHTHFFSPEVVVGDCKEFHIQCQKSLS